MPDSARWVRINELFHAAVATPAAERAAFLSAECGADAALRAEVESLLAAHREEQTGVPPGVIVGSRLGDYEITGFIAAGGMGEVYRAHDTKLGRDVAIKILPRLFVIEPERLARFEREARVLASLNHPNIAAIYGLEEFNGAQALVLELVDGPTLADRLAKGPLPVRDALTIAVQIADALEAAHERGIVHRDLKPANVKITPAGTVKVLDFGLAKAVADDSGVGATQPPTVTVDGTREGVILGTAAYMSPEQARGQAVDKRTDIWAFGCVLYEMLTGRAALAGATIGDTLAAVLEREPDWSRLPASTPSSIHRLLQRCLQKDAKRRLRDIADARLEIAEPSLTNSVAAPPPRSGAGPRARVTWSIAALASAGAIAISILVWPHSFTIAVERPVQFTLSLAEQEDASTGGTIPNPSPDGQELAFIAADSRGVSSVWIRSLDSVQAKPLPGTDRAEGAVIWSPDSRWVAFYADGKLKKASPAGGPPQAIAALPGFQDGSWGSRGEILYRPTNRAALFSVSESGGTPKEATHLEPSLTENSHRGPEFLPDGRRFLFTSRSGQRENNALYIASLDSPQVRRVMPAQSRVSYVPPRTGAPGALVFYRDGALMAQAFDVDGEKPTGEPIPVFDKISYVAASIQAGFRVSADGRVIIVQDAGANETHLVWFNRSGAETGIVGPPSDYLQPRLSPTGDRVAFTKPDESGNRDVWYTEIARSITTRLTVHIANDWYPVWSPDAKQLLFGSDREGGTAIPAHLKKSMDPGSGEVRVADSPGSPPSDWSPDGRWIASGNEADIWVTSATGHHKSFQFLATPFREAGGRFSPDSQWIAYVSNETGRAEVYVRPFSGEPAASEGKIQMSNAGGDFPVWGRSSQELFYMSRDFSVYAVSTKNLGRSNEAPVPSRLFQACPGTAPVGPPATDQTFGYAFDTLDGQRFVVNCRVEPPGRYVVLLNWLEAQTQRVPTTR